MAISPLEAVQAFSKAAKLTGAGIDPRDTPTQSSFGDLVKEVATQSIEAGKAAEKATASAVAGQADLTDVVAAVSNAEMTLQTVVTVRDRVLAAYQEILRMPI
jgi:flagellar hook-basal body complex protein FliE